MVAGYLFEWTSSRFKIGTATFSTREDFDRVSSLYEEATRVTSMIPESLYGIMNINFNEIEAFKRMMGFLVDYREDQAAKLYI